MNEKYREIENNEIISDNVFYANSMSFNLNADELVLTFERRLPGVKDDSRTIILNPKAMEVLKNGMSDLIKLYEENFIPKEEHSDGTTE